MGYIRRFPLSRLFPHIIDLNAVKAIARKSFNRDRFNSVRKFINRGRFYDHRKKIDCDWLIFLRNYNYDEKFITCKDQAREQSSTSAIASSDSSLSLSSCLSLFLFLFLFFFLSIEQSSFQGVTEARNKSPIKSDLPTLIESLVSNIGNDCLSRGEN